ncbi:hypothetical protein [Spirosoma endbachense]|uniref:Uncharacterized protein n=1 Tax=Spirosoma endbachense TaxID=2666025 RepID=A0A6P1VXD3_9BACT|nr:hypothetical protein [Spirosoma endbachense]QHV97294.1 hypothetical protein GJR95_20795 [Spirosoma endbachense]
MINYSMKYGVSETARFFGVDRDTLKTWAYVFAGYLSSEANPGKGKARQFSIEDLRVFAHVLFYWEDEPDIEAIRYGLNSNSHFEDPRIDDFITQITPLFRDMPEGIDETWRGVVFGGEYHLRDTLTTADSFKLAGDKLIEIAHENYEERQLFQPAIYNYRHATELYIKAVTGEEKSHNLQELLQKLRIKVKAEFDAVLPEWFENVVKAFDDSDPKGTAFRYGITIPKNELYADMLHVKELMGRLSKVFKRIQLERLNREYDSQTIP